MAVNIGPFKRIAAINFGASGGDPIIDYVVLQVDFAWYVGASVQTPCVPTVPPSPIYDPSRDDDVAIYATFAKLMPNAPYASTGGVSAIFTTDLSPAVLSDFTISGLPAQPAQVNAPAPYTWLLGVFPQIEFYPSGGLNATGSATRLHMTDGVTFPTGSDAFAQTFDKQLTMQYGAVDTVYSGPASGEFCSPRTNLLAVYVGTGSQQEFVQTELDFTALQVTRNADGRLFNAYSLRSVSGTDRGTRLWILCT